MGPDWRGPGSGPWTPSRGFTSGTAHKLAADADERIAEARKKGAFALAEEGLEIADDSSTASTAEVQKSRLRIDQRNALAGAFNPSVFKDRAPLVQMVHFGDLHIEAMQRASQLGLPKVPQQLEPMPVEIITNEDMPTAPAVFAAPRQWSNHVPE